MGYEGGGALIGFSQIVWLAKDYSDLIFSFGQSFLFIFLTSYFFRSATRNRVTYMVDVISQFFYVNKGLKKILYHIFLNKNKINKSIHIWFKSRH